MKDYHFPLLGCLCAAAIGCGGSGGDATAPPTTPPGANTVSITAPGDSVDVGIRLQFKGKVTSPSGADITSTTTISWSSSNTSVATVDALGFVTGVATGTATITATAGSVNATKGILVVTSAWVLTPSVIKASDYGEYNMSDPGVTGLPGGGFRMYLVSGGPRTAVSSDGLAFTSEASSANPAVGLPRPLALPGGGWKVFTSCNYVPVTTTNSGICSYSTTDGVNFTLDAGIRITLGAAGLAATERLFAGDAVKTASGYRIYFSDGAAVAGSGAGEPRKVMSATSTDLITWTVDQGIRAGGGGTAGATAAEHPGAAVVGGKVILFWFDHGIESGVSGSPNQGLWYSVSTDGLTFTERKHLKIAGRLAGDPSAIVLPNGTLRVYFSSYDCTVGVCEGGPLNAPGMISALTNTQLRF